MDTLNDIFATLSSFLWGWPMIILLLGTHLFLTIRLHFPQRKIFKAIKLSVKKDKNATGDVSQFGALATALAATIGTGNIIGVATAIALGGPGAVLWCWLTGVFGISTKYAEGLLAVKYRVKTQRGQIYPRRKPVWRFSLHHRNRCMRLGSSRHHRRSEINIKSMWNACSLHGTFLCVGMHLYSLCQPCLSVVGYQGYL